MKYQSSILHQQRHPLYKTAQEELSHLTSWRIKGIALLRVTFGGVWLLNALSSWHVALMPDLHTQLAQQSLDGMHTGMWMSFWQHIALGNTHAFASAIAVIELLLALCLLAGLFSRTACCAGIALTLFACSTAQQLDILYGPGANDIGVVITYILVFCGLLLSRAGQLYGLDFYLHKVRHKMVGEKPVEPALPYDLSDPYLQFPEDYLLEEFSPEPVVSKTIQPQFSLKTLNTAQRPAARKFKDHRLAPM